MTHQPIDQSTLNDAYLLATGHLPLDAYKSRTTQAGFINLADAVSESLYGKHLSGNLGSLAQTATDQNTLNTLSLANGLTGRGGNTTLGSGTLDSLLSLDQKMGPHTFFRS